MAQFKLLGQVADACSQGVYCVGAGRGPEFATGGLDGSVKTWTLDGCDGENEVARQTGTYDAHKLSVVSVAIRGPRMATASLDGALKLWDLRMGKDVPPRIVPSESGDVSAVALSKNASIAVAVGGKGTMRVVDCDMGIVDSTTTLNPSEGGVNGEPRRPPMVTAVALSGDDKRAIVGAVDGALAVLDVDTAKIILSENKVHIGPVRQVRFSPAESDIIVSGSEDQLISFYDVRAGKSVGNFRGHTGHVMCLDVSLDGNCVVSGSTDTTVRIWDRRMEEMVFKSREHSGTVWGVTYLSEGKRIVTVSDDGSFVLIDSGNA